MTKLYHWSARRSGGRITITAKDELTGGDTIKIANVDTIALCDGRVVATERDGEDFELVV